MSKKIVKKVAGKKATKKKGSSVAKPATKKKVTKKKLVKKTTRKKTSPISNKKTQIAKKTTKKKATIKKVAGKKKVPKVEIRPNEEAIVALIKKGRARSFVTEQEILIVLPELEEYVDRYEELLSELYSASISVVESHGFFGGTVPKALVVKELGKGSSKRKKKSKRAIELWKN